jgi:hypothetical protein
MVPGQSQYNDVTLLPVPGIPKVGVMRSGDECMSTPGGGARGGCRAKGEEG